MWCDVDVVLVYVFCLVIEYGFEVFLVVVMWYCVIDDQGLICKCFFVGYGYFVDFGFGVFVGEVDELLVVYKLWIGDEVK